MGRCKGDDGDTASTTTAGEKVGTDGDALEFDALFFSIARRRPTADLPPIHRSKVNHPSHLVLHTCKGRNTCYLDTHSASEVTTLWRYTNAFIIIIIIILSPPAQSRRQEN